MAQSKTRQSYKDGLKDGPYAWPGGYPKYLVMADGGAICFTCAQENAREILTECHAIETSGSASGDPGWIPLAWDINWETADLLCDQCGKEIEAAYTE